MPGDYASSNTRKVDLREKIRMVVSTNGVMLLTYGWGHIRFCGHGCWRFRFYSESLSKSLRGPAESNQSAFATFVRCLA